MREGGLNKFSWCPRHRQFPVVRQYDQIDCGPAALLSVLKFWGGDSNIVHVRELAKTDASGTNMLGLAHAAEKLGFRAVGASGEYEDLKHEQMPCIAHVIMKDHRQHFVVIYRIDESKLLIGDPSKGLYKLPKEKFLEVWKQKAVILLKPGDNLIKHASPHWFKWIWSYFKKEESRVYQTIFLGVVSTFLGLLVAIFVQWLIDRFIPERNLVKIIVTGFFLLVLQLLRAGAAYLRQRFLLELNQRVNLSVNTEFLSHLYHLPVTFFNTRKKGDLTARINDGAKIQQTLLQVFGVTIIDGLIILGSFIFLIVLAPSLAWVALATLPVYAVLVFILTRKIRGEQNEVMKSYALVESFYFDSLNGIDDILGYNASSYFAKLNRFFFEGFQKKVVRLGLTQARIGLFADFTASALVISALSFGAIAVLRDDLSLGQMVATYSLLANMIPAINRIIEANIALQGASIAVQRLFDLLLVETEKNEGKRSFTLQEGLHVKHAKFIWPKGKVLFEDLTISIPKGQITSLWGTSGAGKSTLAKILQRKYPLNGGEIFCDSTCIDEIDLYELRKSIVIVPQSIKIFNGPLIENILMGRNASEANRVEKHLEAMGLASFFARFEHGLFTLVGEEGRQLSSGEMQIIGLMRALLDTPEVLIVDEGISVIDAEIENRVFAILRSYALDHAVFVISHNLRSLAKTDEVYLLEKGVISGHGEPRKLLLSHRRFQSLWKMQQFNFIEAGEEAYVL